MDVVGMTRPSVLVFAGADPSGGAGIQADIPAITAIGAHPLTVITALTAQDNDHVVAVEPVSSGFVRQQAQTLIGKIRISAIKIGIVGNRANAEIMAEIIATLRLQQPGLPVVLDPVLASGHGDALAAEDARHAVLPLLPLATIVTPNLPEAKALCSGEQHIDTQAQILMAQGCPHVLIKGGHGIEASVINRWFSDNDSRSWGWTRLPGGFHGSGCTLASALAALLALGKNMPDALEQAQRYCHETLAQAYSIAQGQRIPHRLAIQRGDV